MICKKIVTIVCMCASICFLSACDNGPGGGGKPTGTLYWSFAGQAKSLDLGKYIYNDHIMDVQSRFDAFDISWDQKHVLLSMDVKGSFNFDERRFVLRRNADRITYAEVEGGGNLRDLIFEWESIGTTYGHISPNEKYIAIDSQSFRDLPITVIHAETGEVISQWTDEDVDIKYSGTPIWTADNTLYFRIGNTLYRTGPNSGYTESEHVLDLPESSQHLAVNPQGTKIVFRLEGHLWLANMDGSNMHQITTSKVRENSTISSGGERMPVFSPDGRFIAFSGAQTQGVKFYDGDYPDKSWISSVGGKFGYLAIIPADGKLHDLADKNGKAIWLHIPETPTAGLPVGGSLIWR